MHMCYERPSVATALNGGVGYDKWDRGGGGGAGGAWTGREPRDAREPRAEPRDTRDRERDRERERQARAHQMSNAHAAEPDASSLFPAPFRVTGNRDRVSQQIQIKLGDYRLAQTLLDDPSKSIGICAEPPSPAPCHPSRRENEFKKPTNALQNGRVHHRPPYYNKSEGLNSTGPAAHRPPPLRLPNGIQSQNNIDSSQPPIESILKEMKSLPTPVSGIAATPRKELENKFIFNPFTNKVQENPQLSQTNNDLKTPLTKPGLDNRISNSRSSVSPDVVNKSLGLSESDDEVAATTTRLEPILSPIGSGGSPSSGSESSPSDSESESSSAESTGGTVPPPAVAQPPAQRPSWSLSNFAPPPAHPPDHADLSNVLADAKGKPSPISELSDSEASSPSPGARRRRSLANRISAASSEDEAPRPNPVRTQTSPSISITNNSQSGVKRGRPPKPRTPEERPAKKKRGRPPKRNLGGGPTPAPDSEPEPDPPQHHPLQDTKTHIFRKVFTPKKTDECGGKGGKGGKGKGGKGKGQVTIIESTALESRVDDDERRHRDRSAERRNEEAIARVSPPQEPETLTRKREAERMAYERIQERVSIERPERTNDRIPDRTDRLPDRRSTDRLPPDRLSTDRLQERLSNDRLSSERLSDRSSLSTSDRLSSDRKSSDRLSGDKMLIDRIPSEKMSIDRLSGEKLERMSDKISHERLSSDKLSHERLSSDKLSHERLSSDKLERLSGDKLSNDRLSGDKLSIDRLSGEKLPLERVERIAPDRYVRAEADVGFVQCPVQNSLLNGGSRSRRVALTISIPLSRLRGDTLRSLQRPRGKPPAPAPPTPPNDHSLEGSGAGLSERSERCASRTPIYYSYFERLPADALSDEERDHKYYLAEAKRLRTAAEREQEPLPRVMLYLESVLCFVLTGRVLELELDTKKAFTIYRETIEYIKSIHSMPQRFRASPHSTFSKLDILSLRVQALLYLRMFKMYNREVREYNKIVQEYQQKPACAESVSTVSGVSASSARSASPLSPSPSPAGSVGSGSGSGSSGYCSLAHAAGSGSGPGSGPTSGSGPGFCTMAHPVPAHAHHALLQLTKYYTFLYVAHDLWEQADGLCRLRPNQDLFIAVDRKCGPLTLFSTFRHLVQYVRHAISLLKNAPRE
ncbi:unnamed protein product, partial [Brenthis ino]